MYAPAVTHCSTTLELPAVLVDLGKLNEDALVWTITPGPRPTSPRLQRAIAMLLVPSDAKPALESISYGAARSGSTKMSLAASFWNAWCSIAPIEAVYTT